MNDERWREAEKAQTLMQTHKALTAVRPARDADLPAWREYHRRSAAIYLHIAEVDRGHHHEALYWADREKTKADEIARQLSEGKPQPSSK